MPTTNHSNQSRCTYCELTTAWYDPVTQYTYILVINEALYYGTKLDYSLNNPNQVRSYGLDFWDKPYDKEKVLRIDLNDSVDITM